MPTLAISTRGAKIWSQETICKFDESEPVGNEEKTHIQKVTGKFLWYGRGVDGTILTPLSAIMAKQSKPTINTAQRSQQIMDYLATQEPAVLTYRKSDMVLAVHSDASYLNEEEARSRAGGHHFPSENVPLPPNNSAIHNVAEIIKGVMSSAAKAELGAMYINARKAVEERIILEEWDTNSRPLPFKLTIPLPKASSTNGCNQNIPKPWICISIGCGIAASASNNSDFMGAPAPQTMPTTG